MALCCLPLIGFALFLHVFALFGFAFAEHRCAFVLICFALRFFVLICSALLSCGLR